MASFGEDDAIHLIPKQVLSCKFEILFHLNYGSQDVEYKSYPKIKEHFNLKEEIARDDFIGNLMVKHWLRHSGLNAVDGVLYNDYDNDSIPVGVRDTFSRYKHRRHIKFLDSNEIKKELVSDNFLDDILHPPY